MEANFSQSQGSLATKLSLCFGATFLLVPTHPAFQRERCLIPPLTSPVRHSLPHDQCPALHFPTSISVAGTDRLLSLFFFTAPQYVTLLSAIFPSLRVSDTLLS